jgi:hypothetical protein
VRRQRAHVDLEECPIDATVRLEALIWVMVSGSTGRAEGQRMLAAQPSEELKLEGRRLGRTNGAASWAG